MHLPLLKHCLFPVTFFLMLVIAVADTPRAADTSTETITVRVRENAYPNYFFKDGQWQGIDVDIVRLLMEHAELNYEFVPMPFARALKAIDTGGVDIILNLVKNNERSDYMDWLGPVREHETALIVQQAHAHEKIDGFPDLIATAHKHGLKMGYALGTSFSEGLDTRLKKASFRENFIFVTDDITTARMLQAGRIFGFFLDEFEATNLMKEDAPADGMSLAGLSIHTFRLPGSRSGNYFGISKHLPPKTKIKLEQSMEALRQNGALDALYKKWGSF